MNKHSMLNSFLLAASIAVSGWVARKAADSGERIAAMQASVDAIKESSDKAERASGEAHARFERKLDEAVPRREFDGRVLVLETEQRKTELQLREIHLELLTLKQKL
jgi:hypothetical protein